MPNTSTLETDKTPIGESILFGLAEEWKALCH